MKTSSRSRTRVSPLQWKAFLIYLLVGGSLLHAQVLKQPAGGERYGAGGTCTISWDAGRIHGPVEIALWDGKLDRWTTVASSVPGFWGTYAWYLPVGLSGDAYRLRVRDLGAAGDNVFSGGFFSIQTTAGSSADAGPVSPSSSDVAFHVQPNPACDLVSLESSRSDIVSVAVMDASGRVIRTTEFFGASSGKRELSVGSLPTGFYLVQAHCADGHIVCEKLVVQH